MGCAPARRTHTHAGSHTTWRSSIDERVPPATHATDTAEKVQQALGSANAIEDGDGHSECGADGTSGRAGCTGQKVRDARRFGYVATINIQIHEAFECVRFSSFGCRAVRMQALSC